MKYLKTYEYYSEELKKINKYQKKIIFSTKGKLDRNIGNFFVEHHHGTTTIYYLKSFSWYYFNFNIIATYCSFDGDKPRTYLEERSEQFKPEQIKKMNFLTVEELFKNHRDKVINLYKMISEFSPEDVYHRDKKIPFIQEFSKINDEEMKRITIKIESEKYNL